MSNLGDLSIYDITEDLDELIKEKSEALNTVNIAINEYITLKNEYIVKSNEIRLDHEVIREELGLSRPANDKQTQSYIDDKLKDLLQDLRIADENVKSWKREVDLLNDKISLEKMKIRMFEGDFINASKS